MRRYAHTPWLGVSQIHRRQCGQPARWAPTKYGLAINLKTAQAPGLAVPLRCVPAPTR